MDSGADRSGDAAFQGAKPDQTWFSPVSFRKEPSPTCRLQCARKHSWSVTVADVNLKFIWDVVTRIKIGKKVKAYVVDGSGPWLPTRTSPGAAQDRPFEIAAGAMGPPKDAEESFALVARDMVGASRAHRLCLYRPVGLEGVRRAVLRRGV